MSIVVTNYMGGHSFQPTPIERLKLLLSSGIFGEPKYYISTSGDNLKDKIPKGRKTKEGRSPSCMKNIPEWLHPYLINNNNGTIEEMIEKAIDEALDADFGATISLLPILRNQLLMRKNPQVLAVRACLHPKRVEYTSKKDQNLSSLLLESISRPDDIEIQLQYLLSIRSHREESIGKSKIPPVVPGLLKRIWAKKIESFDRYRMMKYGTSLIDPIRLCHAKGDLVGELLKDGKIKGNEETTWERLRSDGKTWGEIITILSEGKNRFPHMALLRNLRSLCNDKTVSNDQLGDMLEQLVEGVPYGKLFPFRYYSAYKEIIKGPRESEWDSDSDGEESLHESVDLRKECIKEALAICITSSLQNIPRLKGHTVTLCDNSGSAWGAGPSEYSKVRVAEIANLAGLMAASVSDTGIIIPFGDKYIEYTAGKSILEDLHTICKDSKGNGNKGTGVGQNTETGIWLYLDKAIRKKTHIDNLFIYSDMQAGTGGLYGDKLDQQYRIDNNSSSTHHINIPKIIEIYRRNVNPKMNVFSIQVAGYDNSVLPLYMYRGAILSGWTGAELSFARELISLWDGYDNRDSN